MPFTTIEDFIATRQSASFIFCVVNKSQRRIKLLSNGNIEGGSEEEQHWLISDDRLVISGASGRSYLLSVDTNTCLVGTTNSHPKTSVFLTSALSIGDDTPFRNDLEIRVFGQKRSGHHAVMGWLATQFSGSTFFLNDCIPFLDPFLNHINTEGFIRRYRGLLRHGLHGRTNDLTVFPAQENPDASVEKWRRTRKQRLIVSFEDFDLSCYEPHIVPSGYVGGSRKVVNVLVLRDPFNHLASTMRFYGGEFTEECGEHVMCLWKQYAREVLGKTTYLPNRICISYNQWFSSREYRDQVGSWFGVKNTDEGLNAVSPNGGGSSFDKSAYHGKAQAMPVLNRWTEFASDARFLQLFADPELAGYANMLFGEGQVSQ